MSSQSLGWLNWRESISEHTHVRNTVHRVAGEEACSASPRLSGWAPRGASRGRGFGP